PIPGRFERLPLSAPFSVIIDYAHTPDAMEQAIKAARKITKGRLIALFGAGGEREKEKRSIMGQVAERLADFCIVTTDNPRGERQSAIFTDILSGMRNKEKRLVISDRKQAIQTALSQLKEGDTLLLLGKGHEEYLITQEGKRYFSEREIVTSFIEGRNENDH
ncbi:MAG: UDP-N-acetylmuramoyl-L-alanyl-D-glutamate--2,6-diaminopimelate ligase, partial [Clostridia bacterium]|nr:UDP-N-acetylmuramoyl-L-alanyl-D-glutamate--2,6-diaminopimelate ligase [Clostridia bacterium]